MNEPQIWIAIAILALAVIALLLFFLYKSNRGKKGKKLTALAGLAFALVIAGIIFWENRIVGYCLIGAGVLIAVIDMALKLREK